MKILFTYITHPVEPLGIMYLSSYLKQFGHETKLVRIDQQDVSEVIKNFKPNIIASQAMTGGHQEVIEFFRKLKQSFNFISVMGGSHPTFYPKVIEEDGVDICVKGEAEDALSDLMNALENGRDYTTIPNLLVKKDGKIYYNDMRDLREDIDKFPFPDREIAYEHEIWRNQPIRHFIACRGCAYRCTYCFVGDTPIHTNKGIKEIKDLEDYNGIKVLTNTGNWKKINHFFKRGYKGDIISITPFKMGIPIKCTPNHKLFVFRNNKIESLKAEDLRKDDKLCVPIPQEIEIPFIDVYNELKDIGLEVRSQRKVDFNRIRQAIPLLEEDFYSNRTIASMVGLSNNFVSAINRNYLETGIWPEETKITKVKLELVNDNVRFTLGKNEVPAKIAMNKDFCRLVGYYLAEGSVCKHKRRANSYETVFTFGKEEKEYVDDVMDLIEDIFKIKSHKIIDGSTIKVYVGNSIVGHLFKKLFGTGSKNKKINNLLNLKSELQLETLKGWIRGDGDKNMYCATSSQTLAYQLFLVSYKLGFTPGLYKYKTKGNKIGNREIKSGEDYYVLTFARSEDRNFLRKFVFDIDSKEKIMGRKMYPRFENYILLPIRKVEKIPFNGFVYNIEVGKDHTYTANNLAVHNCFNNTIAKIYEGKGKWVRWRNVDLIIKEIKDVFDKYGGKMVYFQDDIFIMKKQWLEEFSEKYRKEIGIPFHCHVRPNLVDEKSAELLARAGCYSVHMALETANDELRNSILQRNMPKETVYDAANNLHKHGIKIMLQNMVGLPNSTLKDDMETLKMNMKIKPLYAWVSIFQPYPGLELTEHAVKQGQLDVDFDKIDQKFFESTVLKIEKKKQREHLQKWFSIAAEYPILYYSGLLHLIINMPRNGFVKKSYTWVWQKFRDHKDEKLYGIELPH